MSDRQRPPTSLLAHALRNDNVALVEAQLRQGADIFEINPRGQTLLAAAIEAGERAAKSRQKSVSGRMFADAQSKIADLLLAHARTLPAERFPLAEAVAIRNLDAVRLNLARDPPGEANAEGYAHVLAQSVQRDDAEMIELLMAAGVSANAQVPAAHNRAWEGMPMLGLAAIGAHVAAIRLLLQHGAHVDALLPGNLGMASGATPLMMAAHTSSLAAVKLLVEAGADLAARDAARATALDHARRGGAKRVLAYIAAAFEQRDAATAMDLCAAAEAGIAYRVRALLEQGADPDQRNAQDRTPLMLAVGAGHAEIVRMLCAGGADLDAALEPEGNGDLWAFAFANPEPKVIECLLEQGLDPNKPRGRFSPPLVLALRTDKKEIIRLLLAHGADVHAPMPPEVVAKVREQRARAAAVHARGARRPARAAEPPQELGEVRSILDYARHFSGTESYELLAACAGIAVDPAQRPFYEQLRAALKTCAALADPPFMPEAERLGQILQAKPQPWKRRRGVIHYVASLHRTLSAYYGAAAVAVPDARGRPTGLFQRLQAEVAERGYTLVYTGLTFAEKGPTRLLLFPLDEPLATLAACGTNAANYGLGTREVVEWCEETRREHPLTVIGAGFDFVELGFAAPVGDSEGLTRRLAEFCPDLQVRSADARVVTAFARELALVRRCFLWWD